MSDADFRTFVTYLGEELRDRPNYVQRRNRELFQQVICLAAEGETYGRPWHPRMHIVRDAQHGDFQVLFEDANATELELWQMVSACSTPSGARVVVKGEWGGLATPVYNKSTWEDGDYAADWTGQPSPVLRKGRVVRLENREVGAMHTPDEWLGWLAANPRKAEALFTCAEERVSGYRARLATREARRYGQGGVTAIAERNQRVQTAASRLENANCNEPVRDVMGGRGIGDRFRSNRQCSETTRTALVAGRSQIDACRAEVRPGFSPECERALARVDLLLDLVGLETARPNGWQARRDSLTTRLNSSP